MASYISKKIRRKEAKLTLNYHTSQTGRSKCAKVEDLVMLKPGTPLVREVDIPKLLDGLEEGEYKVRTQPKGCRWWRHG